MNNVSFVSSLANGEFIVQYRILYNLILRVTLYIIILYIIIVTNFAKTEWDSCFHVDTNNLVNQSFSNNLKKESK